MTTFSRSVLNGTLRSSATAASRASSEVLKPLAFLNFFLMSFLALRQFVRVELLLRDVAASTVNQRSQRSGDPETRPFLDVRLAENRIVKDAAFGRRLADPTWHGQMNGFFFFFNQSAAPQALLFPHPRLRPI